MNTAIKISKEEKQEIKRIDTIRSNIEDAKRNVNTLMSKYLNSFIIIRTENDLIEYIDECIKNGIVSIDTETTGLNVYRDKCVGVCIYTPTLSEAYIPVNHVDYITRNRLDNQLSEEFVSNQLDRLTLSNCKIIMHNANFDIRVIRRIGSYLTCYWDTVIAAHLLNENESHGLKELYNKYILKDDADEFTFGKLFSFKGTTFADIPIDIAAVYAAHDAKMTYELYEFQSQYLNPNGINGLDEVYNLFMNIEMPCIDAICNMEDTGFMFNFEYHKTLQEKYHKLLDDELDELFKELNLHTKEIEEWRKTDDANYREPKLEKDGSIKRDKNGNIEYKKSKSEQLPETDINLRSPTQLSIIIYDVLKWPVVDKLKPRGTGEEILTIYDKKYNYEFAKKLLHFRHYSKMIDAFIDSLPEQVESDGKIHFTLNQYGAKTGRMSASNPNIQQIPSNNEEIRKLFMAPTYYRNIDSVNRKLIVKNTEEIKVDSDTWVFVKDLKIGDFINGSIIFNLEYNFNTIKFFLDNNVSVSLRERYVLIGSDYSQQEPKMLATLCNDENMINDASEGKDLYTAVASRAFNTTYEQCLEHFPKDSPIVLQDNGKWRYATKEEIDNNEYTKLADGENDTYKDGKDRRTQAKIILLGLMYSRGPSALAEQLNCSIDEAKDIMNSIYTGFPKILKFDIESKDFCRKYGYTTTLWGRKRRLTDILLDKYEFEWHDNTYSDDDKQNIIKHCYSTFDSVYWDKDKKESLIKDAERKFRCKIVDNSSKIAQAERQIVNARVQGSASDMTKKALVAINQNKRLKELGFSTITPIHDEILGQCPLANVKECKELFIYDMCNAASDKMKIKITTDPAISFEWYGDTIQV